MILINLYLHLITPLIFYDNLLGRRFITVTGLIERNNISWTKRKGMRRGATWLHYAGKTVSWLLDLVFFFFFFSVLRFSRVERERISTSLSRKMSTTLPNSSATKDCRNVWRILPKRCRSVGFHISSRSRTPSKREKERSVLLRLPFANVDKFGECWSKAVEIPSVLFNSLKYRTF